MNCPHCGALMKDEQVFCESCGRERILVPEFDAEMDMTLQQTISGIADDLADTQNIKPALIQSELEKQQEELSKQTAEQETQAATESKKEKKKNTSSSRKFPILLVVGSMFAVVILITAIVVGFVQYNNNSYDYQVTKAEEMYQLQDYEQMLVYAKKASELAENSSDAKMLIARAYEGLGNTEYMKQMLEAIIQLDPAYTVAYDMLIPLKVEQKEYKQIGELLEKCLEQSVKDKYAEFLTDVPQFSQDDGNFDDVTTVSVKLFAPGNGVIYYNLHGENPIQDGREYISPILLEPGDYEISAVYQNAYGIYSDIVKNTYHVEGNEIEAPFLSLESGAYFSPQYVDIENNNENTTIYYTVDGSQPDSNSAVFARPIPLPLGESHFIFAVFDDDTMLGDYIYADYTLEVNVDMTGAQAVNMLIQSLISSGKLLSTDGRLPDMDGRKAYDAITVIEKDEVFYYLLQETYISPDESKQKTDVYYAINVTTGESYQAKQNESGIFDLSKIE